jgi:L-threonylcarbamoyladenylate synthase
VVIFSQKGGIIELMTAGQFLSHCSADALRQAAQQLKAGALVAFPTETVYGLGADATNPDSVARIYAVKNRPADHPLIVHVSDLSDLAEWADDIPEFAIALAREYWPGPMTLILKRSSLAQNFITGGQNSVGIRIPNHPIALALLEEFKKLGGKGVAAPSANRFGHVSPTTSDAVAEELTEFLAAGDLILDGGASQVGVESTIIDCTGVAPRILRPGAITEAMIVSTTKSVVTQEGEKIRVSGSLENHYAPAAQVLLNIEPHSGDGFIALSSIATPAGVTRLAAPKNNEEFAQVLYEALRSADHKKLARVIVHEPTGEDIAVAIRDRLKRASQGR